MKWYAYLFLAIVLMGIITMAFFSFTQKGEEMYSQLFNQEKQESIIKQSQETPQINVNFIIRDIRDLGGIQMDVDTSDNLIINKIEEGDFLKNDSQTVFILNKNNVAIARLSQTGVSGTGILFSIQFNYSEGTPEINLSNVILTNSRGTEIPYREGMIIIDIRRSIEVEEGSEQERKLIITSITYDSQGRVVAIQQSGDNQLPAQMQGTTIEVKDELFGYIFRDPKKQYTYNESNNRIEESLDLRVKTET